MAGTDTCPSLPVQRPPQMTVALEECEEDYRTLRLGFHSSAGAGASSGTMHGVETAIRAIAKDGLLDQWNTTIIPFYKAVGYNDPYVIEAALELTMEDRVNAVIGGGSSGRSILANYVFSLAGVPQVAQTSTSPLLSNKEKFPTFSRVVPPDDWQGSLLAGIVRDIGWRSISILYSTDDYARELMQIFKDSAEKDGIVIRTLASFVLTEDPDKDLTSQMEQIKKARTNINALIVGNTASALAALKAASNAGLAGPDFVWMGVDGWFSRELITAQDDPAIREAADGSLGLIAYYQQSGPVYEKFLQEWRETPPLQQSAVGPQSPVNVSEACNAACLETPPWGGAYSYDATKLVATAWKSVLEQGGDPRNLESGDLLQAIRTVDLVDSLSGNLSLDELGNPRSRKYDVFQLQLDSPWTAVGTIDDTEGLVLTGGGNLQTDSKLNFGLGPGVVPKDGSGPVAFESEVVEWIPNDRDNAFFGRGEWLFAAQNVYDEWVAVTEEICDTFNVTVTEVNSNNVVYNTTCNVASEAIIKDLNDEYMKKQFGEFDSLSWVDQYQQLLQAERDAVDGFEDTAITSKTTLEQALCSCPLDIPNEDPTKPPPDFIYVKYADKFIPGMNPYSPSAIGGEYYSNNNNLLNLLRIVLPIVIGTFTLLVAGMSCYIMRQRRKAMYGWVVDKSELEFSEPVKVLGVGGMGDVVEARFRGTPVAVKRTLLSKASSSKSTISMSRGESIDKEKYKDKSLGITNLNTSTKGLDIESGSEVDLKYSGMSSGRSDPSSILSSGSAHTFQDKEDRGILSWFQCFRKQSSFSKQLSFDSQSSFGSLTSPSMYKTRALLSNINKALYREMRLVTKLRHPNIVQTMGAVVQKGSPPMLVMELMSNGSVHSIIHNDVLPLDLELVASILSDTAKGLRYLHEAKTPLIHGDLKLMNILVDDRLTAKLSDFGLSFMQGKTDVKGGSLLWMAPELLTGDHQSPTQMSDVYALGITMYEIFTGFKPYHDVISGGITAEELVRRVTEENLRPTIPPQKPDGTIGHLNLKVPLEFLDLMAECWHKNPMRRPNIKEIEERILEIIEEKHLVRTTNTMGKQQQALLQDILPAKVIKALSEGRKVEPESYDPVTIFFSDIVGFTNISQTMPPEKVMTMLDDMYSRFDALVRKHGLFKVETIGDAYMAVGGIPEPQEDHTLRVARFALDAITSAAEVPIDKENKGKGFVQIRVGFHSGSVVASVVGSVNPRYCLFGDTVNVASRMESHSEAKKINMSPDAYKLLMEQCPDAECVNRGKISVKGKGSMNCWFLKKVGDSKIVESVSWDDSYNSSKFNSKRAGGKYG